MLAADTITEVSIHGVTNRGRLWTYLANRAGKLFRMDEIAAAIKGAQYADLSRYVQELVTAGVLEKRGRGSYAVVAEGAALPPQPLPLPSCFAYPEGRRGQWPPLHVPASIDGVWRLVLHLDQKRRPITWDCLRGVIEAGETGASLEAFVKGLVAGGYLRPNDDGSFRLLRRQFETPRLTQAGKPLAHAMRSQHMWRAMKMCGYFTARDLAIAATLPDYPVTEDEAQRYAEELVTVGYLQSRDNPDALRLYRLKSKMNTGPAAPRVMRARFVWDPNLCRVMGVATHVEEVRR